MYGLDASSISSLVACERTRGRAQPSFSNIPRARHRLKLGKFRMSLARSKSRIGGTATSQRVVGSGRRNETSSSSMVVPARRMLAQSTVTDPPRGSRTDSARCLSFGRPAPISPCTPPFEARPPCGRKLKSLHIGLQSMSDSERRRGNIRMAARDAWSRSKSSRSRNSSTLPSPVIAHSCPPAICSPWRSSTVSELAAIANPGAVTMAASGQV